MTICKRRLFLASLALSSAVATASESIPVGDKSDCMKGSLAEFGQYIGDWDIADMQLSQDGTTWTAGAGAKWNFVCIGKGTAIQDFWMPNDGPVGTNLRTWNDDTQSWDIAWTISGVAGFAHIKAKKDALGNIVMHYASPVPNPLRRITFFPLDANGWNWTLEMSTDNGENWTEVYRIRATRSQ